MAPRKIKTLAILAIILGALGIFGALSTALALGADPAKMHSLAAVPGQSARVAEVQAEMSKALMAVANEWKTYNGVMAILTFFVAGALLAGGIMSHKLREQGRRILQIVFVVAIPLDLLRGVISILAGMATLQILREYMPQMIHASMPAGGSPSSAGIESVASGMAEGSAVMGIVIGVGWTLLKIGFYAVGSIYLRKPEVRAAFKS
jgi:hypothetical protein